MAHIRLTQVALILLLSLGSAWASDGARHHHNEERWAAEGHEGSFWRRWGHGSGVMAGDAMEAYQQVARALEVLEEQKRDIGRRRPAEVIVSAPEITPAPAMPPCLMPRAMPAKRQQNDGQIQALSQQIQSLSSVANSVSQASRQVSQTSQQLAQSVTQLSQSTSRFSQSIQSLSQASQQLQQSVQDAKQSAQQANDAARQASESADRAIASAQSSADSVVSANLASATDDAARSMSSLLSAASASAAGLMNAASSQVQAAKADATLARADAATQVEQAQGSIVSVTQAALAVVGTFIGSSLLTIVIFYLILRLRQNRKKRRSGRGLGVKDISYPRNHDGSTVAPYGSETSFANYPADVKERLSDPQPVMTGANRGSLGSVQSLDKQGSGGGGGGTVALGHPPGGKKTAFTLFPKASSSPNGRGSPGAAEVDSPSSRYSVQQAGSAGPMGGPPPSLQQWLRAGTVSPFGTLKRNSQLDQSRSPGWPFEKPRGPQQGVGIAKVMQPGRGLPLRDN